jgi:glycine dehydrogenase subunit 2
MLVRAYLNDQPGGEKRTTILVPESAHGTNPASAARCGFVTETIKSNARGRTDVEHLKSLVGPHVAGMMLTNPNTLGLFEDQIEEIASLIHGCGGLMYCDGANMNALVGRSRPGDMGFDVMHYNLHKTFSTPHGGGGPGSGPVAVKSILKPYLPIPFVDQKSDGSYFQNYDNPKSVGRISSYFGAFMAIMRAYLFILYYGKEDLKSISDNAVLNANYIKAKLEDIITPAVDELCMHEIVFSAKTIAKETGCKAYDIAKRMIDYGYHPPTIYFPLIAPEALMFEPTETESLETIDQFCEDFRQIIQEAYDSPDLLHEAPVNSPVRRLDEVTAARKPQLRWLKPEQI